MPETAKTQKSQKRRPAKQVKINTRLLVAILLGLVLLGINYAIFNPASALAGMLTDSCSGDSNAYLIWEIWLRYLWPVIMLGSSILPPTLIIMNRRLRWILISLAAGGFFVAAWYLLWIPVLFLTGC